MANYLYYDYRQSFVCKVRENDVQYTYHPTVQSYLNEKCLQNGSSLEGRKESFSYLTNRRKFVPVFVSHDEIYFPTEGIKKEECRWINYCEIDKIHINKKTCTIYFKDHTQFQCYHPERIQDSICDIERYLLIVRTPA